MIGRQHTELMPHARIALGSDGEGQGRPKGDRAEQTAHTASFLSVLLTTYALTALVCMQSYCCVLTTADSLRDQKWVVARLGPGTL